MVEPNGRRSGVGDARARTHEPPVEQDAKRAFHTEKDTENAGFPIRKDATMTTEISTVETTALVSHRAATNAAGLCRELVVKTASKIQGKRYVQVEGWQAIANTFGCVASARNVERVEGGFRATGQVIRLSDGKVLAEAEGFVGDDEKTWASRPVFARRAMAQTRAMSRACRSAFAFVVTLMDAGLETTPAEEMTHVIEAEPAAVRPKFTEPPPAQPATAATAEDMSKARHYVQSATVPQLERMLGVVEQRLKAGFYTPAQADELFNLVHGKLDILASEPEDNGQEFAHEAAEHEVKA